MRATKASSFPSDSSSWNSPQSNSPANFIPSRPSMKKLSFENIDDYNSPNDADFNLRLCSQSTADNEYSTPNFKKLSFDTFFANEDIVPPTFQKHVSFPYFFGDNVTSQGNDFSSTDNNNEMEIEGDESTFFAQFTRQRPRNHTHQPTNGQNTSFGPGLLRIQRHDSIQTLPPANSEENSMNFKSLEPTPSLPINKKSYNPDLWAISPQTLQNLMKDASKRYLIIDCRYDYEYQGGHIEGAINVETFENLERLLITHRQLLCNDAFLNLVKQNTPGLLLSANLDEFLYQENNAEAPILVFHCEFSQKRGPRALRAVRSLDRQLNAHRFPYLFYPEVYILEDGYQNFNAQLPASCTNNGGYITMIDKAYRNELVEAKERESKAWKKTGPRKPSLMLNQRSFSSITL